MGLSTKQVAGDHGLDWGPTLLQSGTLELPEPPPVRRLQRQQPPEQLECPRCGSINTKFCYYNNYNKSQPRHFCKACKRHWTKGGTLRNVPVGGARKNKRLKTSSAATFAAATSTAVIDSNTHMGLESQKQSQSLSLSNSDQRTRSGGLIRPPSSLQQESFSGNKGGFTGSTLSTLPQIQNLNFPFPSLGSVFTDPSSLSSSCQSSNDYNCIGGFKTMEATELGHMVFNSSNNIASQPWQVPITSSVTDMPNYWNWDELDTFITTDLNMSWDDTEIKP